MKFSLYLKAAFVFAAVFAAGAYSGVLITQKSALEAQRKPPCTKSLSDRMMTYLARELELTDRQIKDVQPVVNETSSHLGEIHRQALGEASAAIQECHGRLVPFLTEVQAAKLSLCEAERQQFLALECGFEGQVEVDCDR